MRALSLLLRRAAVAGPSVPAETSALGSRARVFFPTCPQRTSLYEDSSGAAVATAGLEGRARAQRGCARLLKPRAYNKIVMQRDQDI